MEHLTEKFQHVNKILLNETMSVKKDGLLHGKMGISLYFFHLANNTNNTEYQEFAERLIKELFEASKKNHAKFDFEEGLAGFAWGIEYLVHHNFIEGNTNNFLKEIDDKLYRYIIDAEVLPFEFGKGVLGYIMYLLARLKSTEKKNDEFIKKRLLIDLINITGERVEEKKIEIQEPLRFDILWDLPISLLLLNRVYSLHICDDKISRILDYLSPKILSLCPQIQSNRLYLLYSIEAILQNIDIPSWREHANFLTENISLSNVFESDFKDKDITLMNGLYGVNYISKELFRITSNKKILFDENVIVRKILQSEYWEAWNQRDIQYDYFGLFDKGLYGLHHGLSGIGLQLLEFSKKSKEEVLSTLLF